MATKKQSTTIEPQDGIDAQEASAAASALAQRRVEKKDAVEVEKEYFIVNPSGAVHSVDYATAKNVLRQVGFRKATAEEIERYRNQRVQRFDAPIAPPFSADPEMR